MLTRFAKEWFGDFDRQELKKFIYLGVIFGFIIGIYWVLKPVKNSVFMSMVGAKKIGHVKIFSLLALFPLVMILGKLMDMFPRHRILYVLGILYSLITLVFGILLADPVIGLPNTVVDSSRILGWLWYIFVESYGSIVVASFWAFAIDITQPESAKRGFPLVVLIGQFCSLLGPLYLTPLASSDRWGSSAYVIILSSLLILCIVGLVALFIRVTPKDQMIGYRQSKQSSGERLGFLKGLTLLLSQPYLMGIFAVIGIYECILTVMDFHFINFIELTIFDESSRVLYLGSFALWVNLVACISLLLGVSNIQRRLGVSVSLGLMPCIVAIAVVTFFLYPEINVLFWIMVGAKGMQYALNGPSVKQLYVPTSVDVKYKSQSWIETFGSRLSRGVGSGINMMLEPFTAYFGPAQGLAIHIAASSTFSLGLLFAWFAIALYLGKEYGKAIEEERVVC
jgi:ATP:ADP antiporter, AAA family